MWLPLARVDASSASLSPVCGLEGMSLHKDGRLELKENCHPHIKQPDCHWMPTCECQE